MELVTERDMDDARTLAKSMDIYSLGNWDEFVHDIAQAIADGRRVTEQTASTEK